MDKKIIVTSAILLLIAAAIVLLNVDSAKEDKSATNQVLVSDYKNTSYIIEGEAVTLRNGISEVEAAPGSASMVSTRYYGNEIEHDLNEDGREDTLFLITQETGGSGTFFYLVAALQTPTGYVGSHAFLLGDRIEPKSISIDEGMTTNGTHRQNVVVVDFTTRAADEPFTAEPTTDMNIWLKLDPESMQFGEVAQDFEGESL